MKIMCEKCGTPKSESVTIKTTTRQINSLETSKYMRDYNIQSFVSRPPIDREMFICEDCYKKLK